MPPPLRGFGRWVRLLDGLGEVCFALLHQDDRGFLLIGDGVLDLVHDLPSLEAELDASLEEERAWQAEVAELHGFPNPWAQDWRSNLMQYQLWKDELRQRIPAKQVGGGWGNEVGIRNFDGSVLRWRVTRQQWTAHGRD